MHFECPKDHKHGVTSTCRSSHGCRCRPCRDNNAAAARTSRLLAGADVKVPALPATRMLQALSALGWGCHQIGEGVGTHGHYISELRAGHRRQVQKSTARKIAKFYHANNGTVIEGVGAKRAKATAVKNRWHPPHCWDDIVNDPKPGCRDECFNVSSVDARIRELNAAGVWDAEIARRLGRSQQNITDRRIALGLPRAWKKAA